MGHFKQKLEQKFISEEAIGFYYEDANTGLSEEDHNEIHPDQEFESGVTYLPDHTPAFICTNCAEVVLDQMGEGSRYGFHVKDNPVTHNEIVGAGGHDFAVFRNRYIVDIWISHFTGSESQVVYDLKDPKDQDIIRDIFGDPEKWSYFDREQKVLLAPADIPADKKISLRDFTARSEPAASLSI